MSTSIVNYSTLQTALANWLHRSDLTTIVPDLIALAEMQLSVDLDTRWQWAQTALTTTASSQILTLPSDILAIKRLTALGNVNSVLVYMPPEAFDATYNGNDTGMPEAFTMLGMTASLGPIPDAVYSVNCLYKQKIPALSATSPTNWLVTAFPNLYLWGAILSAQIYLQNDERMPLIVDLYSKAVAQMNDIEWNRGGSLSMVVQ